MSYFNDSLHAESCSPKNAVLVESFQLLDSYLISCRFAGKLMLSHFLEQLRRLEGTLTARALPVVTRLATQKTGSNDGIF